MKLDGFRLLEEGELSGQLYELLGRMWADESPRTRDELLKLVVERLQTAGKADAQACIEVLDELACRGSVEAKYHLAIAKLAFGDGAKDAAVAYDLLEQVIDAGEGGASPSLMMMALGNTGALLAMGVGCELDHQRAMERLMAASSMGCIESCLNAAILFDPDVGSSALNDAGMSAQFYRKAAAGGSVQAAATLAWKLMQRKVAEDFEGEGLHWLGLAALGGHPAAVLAVTDAQRVLSAGHGTGNVH